MNAEEFANGSRVKVETMDQTGLSQRTTDAETAASPFESLEAVRQSEGAGSALDWLVTHLEAQGDPRQHLDALLLKARHDLKLPLIQIGGLAQLPEPVRSAYEERYIEALRAVGRHQLESGDLIAAWPYYRAIAEKEPVAEAIAALDPESVDGQTLGQIMEIALQHGVHPERGFQLVLESYGICSAITAFEQLPPEEGVRGACVRMLTRALSEQLRENLHAEVERGQRGPAPAPDAEITTLLQGNDWLFEDEAYHIDTSHLSSVVRLSPLLSDPEDLRLALQLTEYGRLLSPRHRYEGDPPFEDTYEDHGIYLRALLGEGVDEAVAHFRGKLPPVDPDGDNYQNTLPGQILVRLLDRVGRSSDAIEIAAEHLGQIPEAMLLCPSLAQLCRTADRLDLLAVHSRSSGDLVSFASAIASGQDRAD